MNPFKESIWTNALLLLADPTTAVKSNPQAKRPGADLRSQVTSPQKKMKMETAGDNFSWAHSLPGLVQPWLPRERCYSLFNLHTPNNDNEIHCIIEYEQRDI